MVDIWGQATIIRASMIEARKSRVRLPKVQEPGRGEGASAEVSVIPPEGSGAGPR